MCISNIVQYFSAEIRCSSLIFLRNRIMQVFEWNTRFTNLFFFIGKFVNLAPLYNVKFQCFNHPTIKPINLRDHLTNQYP